VRGFPWQFEPGGARVMGDGSVRLARAEPERPAGGAIAYRPYFTRISANGTVTQSGLDIPRELIGVPLGGAIQGDGSMLVFDRQPTSTLVIAKFRADGSIATSYGTGGVARITLGHASLVRSALATPDGGTLFLLDSENAVIDGRNDAIVLLKVDEIGVAEPSFGRAGRVDFSTGPLTEFPFQASIDPDGYLSLFAYTTFRSGSDQRYSFYYARIQAVPDIVEFENVNLKHFFIGYDNAEARGIDRGAAGPGWTRTSQSFRPGGPVPVCRFYARGPNSHFYTGDADECAIVKRDPGWAYEGLSFNVMAAPNDGFCPANLRPVHRVYNGRFAQNDSNHRFLVNESFIPSMTGTGWIYEGIVFCVAK